MAEAVSVLMPQMGESIAEGTIVKWLKAPGESVSRDEPLFEISTDKIDTDVPAPVAGVLEEVFVPVGQTVPVNTVVATIATAEADVEPMSPARASDAPAVAPAAPSNLEEPAGHFRASHAPQLVSFRRAAGAPSHASRTTQTSRARSGVQGAAAPPVPSAARSWSPAVLETARRAGLSLAALTALKGSGRGGRVTKHDVEAYLATEQTDAPPLVLHTGSLPAAFGPAGREPDLPPSEYIYRPVPGDRRVAMSPVRRKIAHHMTWSTRISPHASAFTECDMSRAASLLETGRQEFEERVGAPLTYTVLFARAVVGALGDFPVLNASVVGDELILKPHVHLGIAVALPSSDDLIVPVVHDADELSLAGLARAIHQVGARARNRQLTIHDVEGGTFTLTNPGMFGGVAGVPLLNQPQVAIVGVGAIAKRAVVVDDAIAIRPVATLTLTFDHRAADGMVAFRYLERVRQALLQMPRTDWRE